MGALTQLLLTERGDLVLAAGAEDVVERTLEQACRAARGVWQGVALSPQQLVIHLASKLPTHAILPQSLEALRIHELYLARACALGLPAALAAFEERYMPVAVRAVRAIDAPQATREEVLQTVRERLLVTTSKGAAAIDQYSGAGSLEGWVRVTAVRTALNGIRRVRREVLGGDGPEGSLLVAQVAGDDAELEMVRQRYRGELEHAMTTAFERLAEEQRELLRLYVIDGLTLDELGRVNGVSPATVSRWLKRIRDKLGADARRHFAERCGLDDDECESVMRAVKSGMHVSVARLLAH